MPSVWFCCCTKHFKTANKFRRKWYQILRHLEKPDPDIGLGNAWINHYTRPPLGAILFMTF